MHALKWWQESTRMFFAGGVNDGGSASSPSSSPSGGSGGDSVTPAEPAGGGGSSSAAPSPAPATPEPAPAPAPAPEPTPAPAPGVEPPNEWANLGSVDDLDFLAIPPTPAATPAPAAPVTPAAPAPQATPQQPAQAAPGPAPTSAVPQQPAAAPLSASDPVAIADALEANRDAVLTHLATTKFALSEDDIKDLETDVVATMPKLLSRVFIEAQMSMQRFLAQSVPGMVKQFNTVTTANSEAEKKFFDTHKALDINNQQHRQTAVRLASLYRQANPNMPLGQLIQEVGPVVMAALSVNAPPLAASPTATLPRGTPPPFRPAVNGGGGSSPTPEPANEWAGMGQNYDEG